MRTISEAEAQKIIEAPRMPVAETNVFSDINLSHEERITYAKNVLKSRRNKPVEPR